MNEQPRRLSPFADALRRARMHRSLTISDVSRQTLLSDRQIIGLENDDLSFFYTPAFAERAATNYAALLGVDTALDGGPPYPREPAAAVVAELPRQVSLSRPRFLSSQMPLIGFAIVLLSLTAYAARTLWPTHSAETEVIAAKAVAEFVPPDVALPDLTPAPVIPVDPVVPVDPIAPLLPVVPDDRAHRFFMVVSRQTVINARDGRGLTLLSGIQSPTVGRRLSGIPPFEITVGDETGVEIYYLGRRVRPGQAPIPGISVTRAAP